MTPSDGHYLSMDNGLLHSKTLFLSLSVSLSLSLSWGCGGGGAEDFHQSNDTERKANPFVISISVNDVTYADSFDGVNTPGTPLLTGEEFAFPDDPVARYVRLTAILDEDQWLSINEVL